MAVSLSEINSFKPNPDIATGNPGVVLKDTGMVDNLMKAAQYQSENDWRKYTTFLNNYKEFIKDVNAVQQLEVMNKDRNYLNGTAKGILQQIAEDPRAFFGAGNSQKLAEINSELAGLYSDATMSKQDNLFDKANRNFLATNPELNTDENKTIVEGFAKGALRERRPYTLNLPSSFDAGLLAGEIETKVSQPFTDISLVGKDLKTPGDEFIKTVTGTKAKKEAFMQLWQDSFYSKTDKHGHSIQKAVKERYNQLSPEDKSDYEQKGGINAFFAELGEKFFGGELEKTKITDEKVDENKNYLKDKELELERQRVQQGWARLNLDNDKLNKEKSEDIVSADSVLKEFSAIVNKGVPYEYKKGGKVLKSVVKIADPNLMVTFEKIDKDGNMTNVPDEVFYDKKTGQFDLMYYEKDTENKIVKDSKGNPVVEHTTPIDERTYIKTITKRSFPNKDIGGVNSIIEQVVTGAGGSLFRVAEQYKGVTSPQVEQTQKSNKNVPTYKASDLKAAGWTDEQVKQAIQAGKINVN